MASFDEIKSKANAVEVAKYYYKKNKTYGSAAYLQKMVREHKQMVVESISIMENDEDANYG